MTAPASQQATNKEYFDRYFVDFLSRHWGEIEQESKNIIMQLCQITRLQHACLDLAEQPADTIAKLAALPFVGGPTGDEPLLLVHNKLFLHRYYHFEREVGERITALNQPLSLPDADLLRELLDEQFGQQIAQSPEIDLQRAAAQLVASRQLAIITGGPGTGKTSLVIKLLAIILKLQPELKINLATPTGKAAARLTESIRQEASDPSIQELEVTTLHRLLGMRKDGHSWRHGQENPIRTDLLIVDEVSMIDLALMHRLLDALPQASRLVLIGDPHQLPPVGAGNTLADLCSAGNNRLANAICQLETNYRFKKDSAIGQLAAGIKSGDAPFLSSDDGAVTFRPLAEVTRENCGTLLLEAWQDYFNLLAEKLLAEKEINPSRLLRAFDQARVLCGNRLGFPGLVSINHIIEQELEKRGIKTQGQSYYPGRPVMVTENNYNLRLFNGDTGICVLMDNGAEMVAFPDTDFPATEERIKYFPASRLPAHESCFAMSVHKSQGSEFAQVTLLLSDQPSPESSSLFTRELLYTAVTRTRASLIIYGSEEIWHQMLQQTAVKASAIFLDDAQHEIQIAL